MIFIQTKYIFENCHVVQGQYRDGSLALRLVSDYGEPVCIPTVWVEGYVPPTELHVLIKDWSENEGIAGALVDAGVIKLTGKTIKTGFVEALEAIVNDKYILTQSELQ